MKQVLLDLLSGNISVEEVPIPTLKNGVIVKTHYSLISAGTEFSLIHLAGQSLLGKAQARPDLFQKVLNQIGKEGILSAYDQAMSRLSKPEPLGYSSAGVVVESNVPEFSIGDPVACGGVGYATHAEYAYVPKNLCVKVPAHVSLRDASFTTVGAIAMQGVRNAQVVIGERVAVIGLGLIGLLTVQILEACGCKIMGIDIDSTKLDIAKNLGAHCIAKSENALNALKNFSEFGADVVIITAATKSNAPIIQAGELVRNKGRVVVVGDVGMEIPRDIFYNKECELVISRSYGLGRYDREYEEKGIDYPIYVRWTERRNMESFIELLSSGKIQISPIITHVFPVEKSPDAYTLIQKGDERFIGILLKYDTSDSVEERKPMFFPVPAKRKISSGQVNIGFIGAGVHALSALLPNLKNIPVNLKGIATTTGLSSMSTGKKYGFEYCTTDYHDILQDPSIDSVFISTRNDTHARITIEALNAGKNVFVEKPLATSLEELAEIVETWKKTDRRVMVGFNRRYSPLSQKLKTFFTGRHTPLIMTYRVNAGIIPKNHWVHDQDQGGSMLITEGCHFIDYFQFLTGSPPVRVYANSIKVPPGEINSEENIQIHISYEDGSIGTVTYTTLGDGSYSKERIEVFSDQSMGIITDFRELYLILNGKIKRDVKWFRPEKGFSEELKIFSSGDKEDFMASIYSTLTTLLSLKSLRSGNPEAVNISIIGL